MKYEEPTMQIILLNMEEIVRTSDGVVITDPDKKLPGEGEDTSIW